MSALQYKDCFTCEPETTSDAYKSIENIKNGIAQHYQEIGIEFEPIICTIFNDRSASCPRYCSKELNPGNKNDRLRLHTNSTTLWCKVIFQLSHEMTHYFINRHKSKSEAFTGWEFFVGWAEETVCEAMALYFLKYFSAEDNWKNNPLSKKNPGYFNSIRNYLNDEIDDTAKKASKSLSYADVEVLKNINANCNTHREYRGYEMLRLFEMIRTPDDIKALVYYCDYAQRGTKENGALFFDAEKYMNAFPQCDAVKYLCELQKSAVKR